MTKVWDAWPMLHLVAVVAVVGVVDVVDADVYWAQELDGSRYAGSLVW